MHFTPYSSVSIVSFEQVIAVWDKYFSFLGNIISLFIYIFQLFISKKLCLRRVRLDLLKNEGFKFDREKKIMSKNQSPKILKDA